MRRLIFRLIAYHLAGIAAGTWAWFAFFGNLEGISAIAAASAAAVGVVLAVALLISASRPPVSGIRINTAWVVAAMDAVALIAAAIAVFFIVDGYAERFYGIGALGTDPLASDVIAVMLLPAALVLAAFVTANGSQSIAIDDEGVEIQGAFRTIRLSWADIVAIAPDDQYVVVGRLDTLVPSKLQVNLELRTAEGGSHSVYQPGLKRTAALILDKLRGHAPERLHGDLDPLDAIWR